MRCDILLGIYSVDDCDTSIWGEMWGIPLNGYNARDIQSVIVKSGENKHEHEDK